MMKAIEIKEWKNNWQIKWAEMTANMQDYNNPQLPRYLKEEEGGKSTFPNKPETERSANHTVKYCQAEHRMVRLLDRC